jgi:hypothetical protein
VVGSDHRAGTPFRAANTDTMMLIRLDPNSSTINVLSIPRDLQVDIPGVGTSKINSAYSVGGPNLLIRTIRQNVFPDLKVNYNNTAVTDYSSINLQPGYQKLCGSQALSFVRFRHTDSDIVRNARQQDFVRWAEQQYSQDQLISNRDTLVRIFGKHAQTDQNLHTTDGLINLFNLVAFMDGHTIKQVKFPAQLQPCGGGGPTVGNVAAPAACYVTADHAAEQHVFGELMTPTASHPVVGATPLVPATGHKARRRARPSDLTADLVGGKAQAAALRRAGMPVYHPRVIAPGSSYCSDLASNCYVETGAGTGYYPRAYKFRQDRRRYSAYRMTIELNPLLGEYYGIQGMTWQHPPILNSPSFTRMAGGKQLLVYTNGGKVSVVAWRTGWGVYWVSNTLTDTLSPHQMIGIAASLTRR